MDDRRLYSARRPYFASRGRLLLAASALVVGLALAAGSARAQNTAAPQTHTVEAGDTLYSLARRYGLTVEALQQLNGLEGTTIRVGQELVVAPPPPGEGAAGGAEEAAPPADEALEEEAAPPEPVSDSAEVLPEAVLPQDEASPQPDAAPPADTTALPPLRTGAPQAEAPESTPAGEPSAAAGAEPPLYGTHTVADAGATLYTIAYRYGIAADTLRTLNPSLSTFLQPGQRLRLPPSLAPPTHVVAEGETIYDVAAQYGISVRGLLQANGLNERDVTPGQRLLVPGRQAPQPEARAALPPIAARGPVQVYPEAFAGRLMAGGRTYDPQKLTVSHPRLPFGTVVLIENPATGRQTLATVADRGPFDEAFLMDVSAAVARRLGLDPERSDETAVALRVMR